ncbi:MAG: bifunctional methylenetetrahydrofolate dehydrogenase/methenyltetrahydrofolate cyclohydrolase FolD [Alicyclobacillaceae bacterium]|nr:bifunctional methylenetetrahydrofolate dehydrogenase/methenyltetrahydrofolate cyclohydrolase FolD [Alicyclobacillaceae bacterium]
MTAKILDGKQIAASFRQQIKEEVETLKRRYGMVPGLAVLLVGDDPASHSYVRGKEKASMEVGIHSVVEKLPADLPQEELLRKIDGYNANPSIHGILVQLPLPEHIAEEEVIARIAPEKDVDGFHPWNVGQLYSGGDGFVPCTPAGILEMIRRTGIEVSGKHAVVVGRSGIVGRPVAQLLLRENATVTICHSKTKDLGSLTRQADILVAAVGRPRLITADMVKPGALVIDVGVNRVEGRLVGDVDFEAVKEVAGWITPVPGGVGPMTITMLLYNTLWSAKRTVNAV